MYADTTTYVSACTPYGAQVIFVRRARKLRTARTQNILYYAAKSVLSKGTADAHTWLMGRGCPARNKVGDTNDQPPTPGLLLV